MPSRFLARQRAFTLIELLVVILIVAILIAVAAPSFLGQQDKAHDSAAKQQLTVARKAAKAVWTSEGQRGYPALGATADAPGSDTLIGQLKRAEPQYGFVAHPADESSTQAISVRRGAGGDSVELCLASKAGGVFCLRTDETGADNLPTVAAASPLDTLLGVENAYAAGAPVAYATGATELDARCVLADAAGDADELEECADEGVNPDDADATLGWDKPVRGPVPAADDGDDTDGDDEGEETTPPDTTAPETTIESGPPASTDAKSATVTFAASETPASFECRLDSGTFQPCVSPHTYTGLSAGEHTVSVRAKDTAGNTDQTPATRTWTVLADYRDVVVAEPSLVSLWGFDDDAGSTNAAVTAGVSSDSENRGSITNVAFGEAGMFGTAAKFNGTSSAVTVNAGSDYNSQSFSLEAWVKPANANTLGVFSKSNGANTCNDQFYAYVNAGTAAVLVSSAGFTGSQCTANSKTSTGSSIATGQWSHVVYTYDTSAHTLNVYINGTRAQSVAATQAVSTSGDPLLIGRRHRADAAQYFNGLIDEPAYYNAPLSAAKVCAHYKTAVPSASCAS